MNTEPVSINFRLLAERFQQKGDAKWLLADAQKKSGEHQQTGTINSYVAQAYFKCAEDVRRVLAGEIPPPIGMDWPEKEEL